MASPGGLVGIVETLKLANPELGVKKLVSFLHHIGFAANLGQHGV